MRFLANAVVAATLLAATGCCWSQGSGACVVQSVWGAQACRAFEDQYPVCIVEQPEPQPLDTCAGSFHGGEDCPALGFTVRCDDGGWVRPGGSCS